VRVGSSIAVAQRARRWSWVLWSGLVLAGCVERGEVLSRNPRATSALDAGRSSSEPVEPFPTQPPTETMQADASPQAGPVSELQGASSISVGGEHACAVFTAGVACWGSNTSGQLGLGDAFDRTAPSLIAGTEGWLWVQAAEQHSCGIDDAGAVYCWGANDRGQLATGDRQSRPEPVAMTLPARAVRLASRFNHSCALLADGALYCWGENFEGQLGQADSFPGDQNPSGADSLVPLEVVGEGWSAVDTGQGHTCAVAADSGLWCWGRNTESELGAGEAIQVREPQRVDAALDWAQVSAGQASTCAIKRDGSLWCWGENVGFLIAEGAPLGVDAEQADAPTEVGTASTWRSISTRTFHSCGLLGSQLWCWGRNIEGQLGLGDLQLRQQPTQVGGAYVEVSAGPFVTCAVTQSGHVECTGKNDVGELGTGDALRRSTFTEIEIVAQ
jgi:alpha-tubulin suppressor-like RCC1 family protein